MNKISLKKTSGFSLLEVIFALAVVGVLSLGIFQLSELGNNDRRLVSLAERALNARNHIENSLKSQLSWRRTVSFNESLKCFNAGGCIINSSSGSDGYYDFTLIGYDIDRVKALSYDNLNNTTRISMAAAECPEAEANPSRNCPLKYVGKWKPICKIYPCLAKDAQVEMVFNLVHDFQSQLPMNVDRYALRYIKDFQDSSYEVMCVMLGGEFDSAIQKCFPKNRNKSCTDIGKPYQIISSINSDGTINCKPLYVGQCDAHTQFVSGIDTKGQAICENYPVAANCNLNCGWSICEDNESTYNWPAGCVTKYSSPGNYPNGKKSFCEEVDPTTFSCAFGGKLKPLNESGLPWDASGKPVCVVDFNKPLLTYEVNCPVGTTFDPDKKYAFVTTEPVADPATILGPEMANLCVSWIGGFKSYSAPVSVTGPVAADAALRDDYYNKVKSTNIKMDLNLSAINGLYWQHFGGPSISSVGTTYEFNEVDNKLYYAPAWFCPDKYSGLFWEEYPAFIPTHDSRRWPYPCRGLKYWE